MVSSNLCQTTLYDNLNLLLFFSSELEAWIYNSILSKVGNSLENSNALDLFFLFLKCHQVNERYHQTKRKQKWTDFVTNPE